MLVHGRATKFMGRSSLNQNSLLLTADAEIASTPRGSLRSLELWNSIAHSSNRKILVMNHARP